MGITFIPKPMSDAHKTKTQFVMGSPCKRGHDGKRYKRGHDDLRGGSCVECSKIIEYTPESKRRKIEYGARQRATPEYAKRYAEYRARYDANPENQKRKAETAAVYRAKPENKQRHAEWQRKANYDITPLEYNCMLAGQQFRCALCGTDDPGSIRGWNVDHCHETNAVRGILCHVCNLGLGKLGDTPEALYRAYLYTKGEYSWTQTQQNSPTPTDAMDGQSNHWPNTAQVENLYIPLSLAM